MTPNSVVCAVRVQTHGESGLMKCRTVGKSETSEMAAQHHVLMIFTICLVGDALCVVNTSSGHGTVQNRSDNVAVNTSNVNSQQNVTSDEEYNVEYTNGVNGSVQEQSVYGDVDLGNATLLENKTVSTFTDESGSSGEQDLKPVKTFSTLGKIIEWIPVTSNVSSKPRQNMTAVSTDQEEYYDIEYEETYADNSTLNVTEAAEMELFNETQLESVVDISNITFTTNFQEDIVLDDSQYDNLTVDKIGRPGEYLENLTLSAQNMSLDNYSSGEEYAEYDFMNTTDAIENVTNMNGSIQEQSNQEIFELNNGTDSMLTDAWQDVLQEREDFVEDEAANSTLRQSIQEKNISEGIRVDGGETLPPNVNGIAWLLDLLLGTNDTSDSAAGDTEVSDFVLPSNASGNAHQENALTTAIDEASNSLSHLT